VTTHLVIRKLEAATKLTRPSLYTAFGGKEQMFLAVLRRYGEPGRST
jgi:AcrR family transcriptional regulator